ncbi:MAG: hypothetical protein ACLU84_06760 [Clostridia bacterium]
MTEAEIENIKNDYLQGMKYKDIINKYDITQPELRSIIRKNKLTRSKSKIQKGNQNAIGNSGGHGTEGNKNAVTTGEYENIFSSVLDDDENTIMQGSSKGTRATLLEELKILTIREKRMLSRIKTLKDKNRDLTITKMQKNQDNNFTEAQSTLLLISKIEDGLTRVQESKRRMLDLLYKIECDDGAIVETPNEVALKKNTNILDSINKQLLGGDTNE